MRYAVPFVLPLLGMGLGASARLAGLGAPGRPGRRGLPPWSLAAALALAIVPAPTLPGAVADYARATDEIRALHLPMAKRVTALPRDARVGVTDAGALAWYGAHPTVDLVGLTTGRLAADQYIAGPGAQLEAVEGMPVPRRPSHVVTFSRPNWWFPKGLLGRRLATFGLSGPATIVGGPELSLWEMDLAPLDDHPRPPGMGDGLEVVDSLDVADLGSERGHRYALLDPGDPRGNCVIQRGRDLDGRPLAEGGRIVWIAERFRMHGVPGRPLVLVLRTRGQIDRRLALTVNGRRAERTPPPTGGDGPGDAPWSYAAWSVPAHQVRPNNVVEAARAMGPVGSFRWWSVTPKPRRPR